MLGAPRKKRHLREELLGWGYLCKMRQAPSYDSLATSGDLREGLSSLEVFMTSSRLLEGKSRLTRYSDSTFMVPLPRRERSYTARSQQRWGIVGCLFRVGFQTPRHPMGGYWNMGWFF